MYNIRLYLDGTMMSSAKHVQIDRTDGSKVAAIRLLDYYVVAT